MQFEHATPESVGVPSKAVMNVLKGMRRNGVEMHSMMLIRHGKVYAEGWWKPFSREIPHIMYSFSKSLTSTAIGFAVQEGILSLDERLVEIYKEKIETVSDNLNMCTLRHLLMMGCGHESEIEVDYDTEADWLQCFLEHPFVYQPGTHFLYNTAGTNVLAAVLKKKTGQGLVEFLRPRLFDPLGMSESISCMKLMDGTDAGGFGFKLKTEDMATFIQFVLKKGSWNGKPLLPEAWFDEATAKQIDNGSKDNNLDWGSGYGYQFWRCSVPGVFRGDGMYGQFGIVMPEYDAVIAITSASLDLQRPLDVLWEALLPEMKPEALPENSADYQLLSYALQQLELPYMCSIRNYDSERKYNGKQYEAEENSFRLPQISDTLRQVRFQFEKEGSVLTLCFGDHMLKADLGLNGDFALTTFEGVPYALQSRWRAYNKLEVELRDMTFAFGMRFLFHFKEGGEMLLMIDGTLPEEYSLTEEQRSIRFKEKSTGKE